MSLTIKPVSPGPRDLVMKVVDATFSASYPTNGEPITPADYEMSRVLFVAAEHAHAGKLQPYFDPATSTLRLVATGSGSGQAFSEVSVAANESAITARLLVVGIK